MKKIIFLILVVTVNACLVQAQQGQTFGSTGKVLSVDEVNILNGTPQTTINGIPYSQFKAQQDALKQQEATKAVQNKTVIPAGTTSPATQQGNPVQDNTIFPDRAKMVEPVATTKPAAVSPAKVVDTKQAVKPEVITLKSITPSVISQDSKLSAQNLHTTSPASDQKQEPVKKD